MLYRILKVLVRWTLHVYFRRIYVLDADKMPRDKPVLLACNHPNSFMEAVMLACFLERQLHFLVRGDVFENPRFLWFFRGTNQVPIYRFRDGFANMRSNTKTFEYCYEKLREGNMILIFAEGSTKMVRRLRPLQKGAARIAMGAMEFDPTMDLQIVPVGVNFSNPLQFRSEAWVVVGDAIPAKEYAAAYKKDNPGTLQVITERLARHLQPCVVHIPEHIRESDVDPLFTILRSDDRGYKGPFSSQDRKPFEREFGLAKTLGGMSPKFYGFLLDKLDTLRHLMPRLHFNRPVTYLHRSGWGRLLLGLIMCPIYLASVIYFAIPWGVAHWVSSKKVKQAEFYGPIRMAAGSVLSMLWFVVTIVLVGLFLPYGWYWGAAVFPLMLWIRVYMRDFYTLRLPGMLLQVMLPYRRRKVRNQFDQLYTDVEKLAEKQ